MHKKILLLLLLHSAMLSFSQSAGPGGDDDHDGVINSEDLCPNTFGSKANKGCPDEKPGTKKTASKTFIEAADFSRILKDVYDGNFQLNKNVKLVYDKLYTTAYKKNGAQKNLPVWYVPKKNNNFAVIIPLSTDTTDIEEISNTLNQLLANDECCVYKFNAVKLSYRDKTNSYEDVLALNDFGVLFYLGSTTVKNKKEVQLRITRVRYNNPAPQQPVTPPQKAPSFCDDIKTILSSCENDFTGAMGSFIKKEPPSEYYTTTLPKLGCTETHIANSISLAEEDGKLVRKRYKFYSTKQEFSNKEEAKEKYAFLKAKLKECCSGIADELDQSNQKIFTMDIIQGKVTITARVVMVDLFGQIVSLSFRIKEE